MARIASYGPHFGEEAPLVGRGGSGTVFFAGCNLCCCFCQNYGISQGNALALEADARALAAAMLELQAMGCHNINLVTPSHVVPQILAALIPALEQGLDIPVVFNCGGYESAETLALLDGVVDILCRISSSGDRTPQTAMQGRRIIRSGPARPWRSCIDKSAS
ncbi:MAG: hypothetical protein FWD79_02500 [Desulfobulbus sp.]|nr:hypothetical protein [Desulfobulbus sp.]